MFKVNSEKILSEYKAICEKKERNSTLIEKTALAFAESRGYDEGKTSDFVLYVLDLENYGLTYDEIEKFEILKEYIANVEVVEQSEA